MGFSMKILLTSSVFTITTLGTSNSIAGDFSPESYGYYLPYAIMASDIYRTEGFYNNKISVAISSPWLREKINSSGDQKIKKDYLELMQKEIPGEEKKIIKYNIQADEGSADNTIEDDPNGIFINDSPSSPDDCQQTKEKAPKVDIGFLNKNGWSRVPELHKSINIRRWKIFVPDFAYDVWRKQPHGIDGSEEIEYAIVFRGTVGSGGWFSDFRIFTMLFPIFWDQYNQAKRSTKYTIEQIKGLHEISDKILGTKTRIKFTSVGHSLGGGLAEYIYMTIPEINTSVTFNSSPVNGSRTLVDRDLFNSMLPRKNQEIYSISERSEILTSIAPCHDGAIWGSEGGPIKKCKKINESHGTAINQHSMAQLACNIHHLHKKETQEKLPATNFSPPI